MSLPLLCLLITVILGRAIEIVDGSRLSSKRPVAEVIRVFMHVTLFAIPYALTWRPLTSMVLAVLALCGLSVTNTVKKRVVFEPLVFSDIGLLGQVVRHPELYFMDKPAIILPIVATSCGAMVLAFWLETALTPWPPAYVLLIAGWLALFFSRQAIRRQFESLLLNEKEGWGSLSFGLLTSLVLQYFCWLDARNQRQPVAIASWPDVTAQCDIIVVQLESFVDMSPHMDGQASAWAEFTARSRLYGKLRVQARGANTMRTEHSVLSGVSNSALGFDRFDPYLRRPAARHGMVEGLRNRGWSTIFLHPNDLSFFRRSTVLPLLGFDTLLGRESFGSERPIGPYIGDGAVIGQIIQHLTGSDHPTLIFAITMENHGPWKAGRLPGSAPGLASYLAHQQNTDAALKKLLAFAGTATRRTIVVLYGDHTPALKDMPATLNPYETDYLIFDSHSTSAGSGKSQPLTPENLLKTALALI